MRVLGVDPGLTRCGVGVVEGVPGRPCTLVAVDVVLHRPGRRPRRCGCCTSTARSPSWSPSTGPSSVAVERVFSQHNVRTVMGTAQASAVAVLAGARAGLPVQTYTPSEVKAAVTGSGQADKAQVTAMVTRLLRLAAPPRPADAADALALAICHVWRGGTRAKLGSRGRPCARQRRRAMIASVRGTVAADRPGRRRGRGRRRRPAPCTARPARSPGCGSAREARLATSLVVREDSLTLYGFADDDAQAAVRAAADGQRGRARGWPRRCSPCTSPTSVRKAIATGDIADADPGARHRQEGRRAAGAGAARPDRPGRRSAPTAPAGVARRRPGRTRCARRWSASAGRPAQADQAVAAVAETVDGAGRRRCRCCSSRRSGCWAGPDDRDERRRRPGLGVRRRRRARRRGDASGPRRLAEFIAQHRVREQLDLLLQGAMRPRHPARPHPALRPARAGQDHAGQDRRGRAGRRHPDHQRAGDRALRRPGRDPDQPRRGRRAVHRRDPPHRQAGRGAALQRDGGLPGRRGRRQGPGRHRDPARRRAVHAGRRDHPGRPADRADAGPVRLRRRTSTSTTPADLDALLHRSARILGVPITAEGATEIAGRSRGTPRIANRLLRRVRDFAEVRADGVVDAGDRPGRAEGLRRGRRSAWTGSTGRC